MTTYTLSTVALPVTRGRPIALTVGARPPSNPDTPPLDLEGSGVAGFLSWGLNRHPMVVTRLPQGYQVEAEPDQTHNLPATSPAYVVITLTDTAGETHDIVFPLEVKLVPNL